MRPMSSKQCDSYKSLLGDDDKIAEILSMLILNCWNPGSGITVLITHIFGYSILFIFNGSIDESR